MLFPSLDTANRSLAERHGFADEASSKRLEESPLEDALATNQRYEGDGVLEGAAVELLAVASGALLGGPVGACVGGFAGLFANAVHASDLRGDLWFYEKVPGDTVSGNVR